MSTSRPSGRPKGRANPTDYKSVLFFLAMATVLGVVTLAVGVGWATQDVLATATSLLWALGSGAMGSLVGFLFGIPRVMQDLERTQGDANRQDPGALSSMRYQVNTNLEEISDWLTKMLVGIGLVELGTVPGALRSSSEYLATTISRPALAPAATGLLVYFTVLGFFLGYLVTRLYLAAAFSRADRSAEFAGMTITTEQQSAQQSQLMFSIMRALSSARRTESRAPGTPAPSHDQEASILWVDDHPENNAVLIQNLTEQGIAVRLAASTREALGILDKQPFTFVITDMGRMEDGVHHPQAGFELLEELARRPGAPQVLVYTTGQAAASARETALERGAALITSDPIELLDAIGV